MGGNQRFEAGTSATGAGRIEVSGGLLDINAGTYAINFTVDLLNASVLGTLLVDIDLSAAQVNIANGGTLAGTGTLTITGTGSQWTGGGMTGGGTTKIAVGADLTIAGANRKFLANRTIQNEGTLIEGMTNVEIVELDGTAVLNNVGVFDIRNDRIWENFSAPVGTLTINNTGTLKKTAGTGAFTFDNTRFNNSGSVEIQTGTVTFDGTGLADGVSSGGYTISNGSHTEIRWRQPT